MELVSVNVAVDIEVLFESHPPRYRVYLENEMFCERVATRQQVLYREILQISANPGTYHISARLVDVKGNALTIKNIKVLDGPALAWPSGDLEIRQTV